MSEKKLRHPGLKWTLAPYQQGVPLLLLPPAAPKSLRVPHKGVGGFGFPHVWVVYGFWVCRGSPAARIESSRLEFRYSPDLAEAGPGYSRFSPEVRFRVLGKPKLLRLP